MEEETKRLLTVKETCSYLRISAPTLYRMIERGELLPVKIGKHTLFEKKDLDELIESSKRVPGKRKARVAKKGTVPKTAKKQATTTGPAKEKKAARKPREKEPVKEEAPKKGGEQGQLL